LVFLKVAKGSGDDLEPFLVKVIEPWTGDPIALAGGTRRVSLGRENPPDGTAMFDALIGRAFLSLAKSVLQRR
jgi:hypothetical protein